ncbi:M24 family metallopeptidase [Paenibacillus harenae]|uniref:Xaa-Pro aminopeptidase n=1 Tax=Paenibacillus harenae TaxID=306543 RepID=A0ABT9U7L6_PAEHA|nr:Xaa-Pro peptidase family protein [Paenibacillus harenae]MDQ0115636.1 Xaa-Pro aminopeptidase [Paenibacillus harenae]
MNNLHIEMEIPAELVRERIGKLQSAMQAGQVDVYLVTQNVDIYYLSGSMQNGYLFVPGSGEPTFYVKRSLWRAGQETLLRVQELGSFKQFRATLEGDYPELLGADRAPKIACDLDVLPALTYLKLAELLGAPDRCRLIDGSGMIRTLRMIKSSWEISRIERAALAVSESLEEALGELREGVTELEWMALLEYKLRKRGHIGMMRMRGYNQEIATGMVISGAAAAVPSYFDGPAGGLGLGAASPQSVSTMAVKRNEPILIDIGCCIDGYVIDQTRTAVIGQLSEPLMAAYERSEQLLLDAEQHMIPGAICSQLYIDALAGSESAGLADHFMGFGADRAKFLGHGIGLEIDEWPVLARGFDIPLQEGMVIAVEPKFTFPGFGVVGVENSYLIEREGARALTRTPLGLIVLPY